MTPRAPKSRPIPDGAPRLYTLEEAAAIFRVRSRSTVYAWILAGTLPSVRIGKRYLVSDEAIRDFISSSPAAGAAGGGS